MAVATYVPAGLLAAGWVLLERADGIFALLAVMTAVCAVVTLYTTGMIYASLRTIRQWHQPLTAPIYIALGLASGAVLLNLVLNVFGRSDTWSAWLAVVCLGAASVMKCAYWQAMDTEPRTYTVGAATGLGYLGKVRPLEPPHTQPNYVMREMGYRVARKHAEKLRLIVLVAAFTVPIAVSLLSLVGGAAGVIAALLAALSMALGLVVERWLFFAEAQHVVMLYYGEDAA
jgi:DMSO reductase anchor subunit